MRILLIHNYYQRRGGEDVYFDLLSDLLQKDGHTIFKFTKHSKNISSMYDKTKTATGLYTNPGIIREVDEIVHKFKPDIAHCNNIYPLITPAVYFALRKNNIKILQTIHNYRFMCPKGHLFRNDKICDLCVKKQFALPAIVYKCYHNSYNASFHFAASHFFYNLRNYQKAIDHFIFTSTFTKNYYLEHTNIPESKAHIIPYCIQTDTTPSGKKSNHYLFAGRLSPEKGVLQLLQIFSQMPNQKLIVVGDGPLKNQVLKYKQENITVLPFASHDDVMELMRNARFTIIPSLWYETGPLVMIESMAKSTPVITPNYGSFTDTVSDGINGIEFQANNLEDLKEKIAYSTKIVDSSYSQMSNQALKTYNKMFTPAIHLKQLNKLYIHAAEN